MYPLCDRHKSACYLLLKSTNCQHLRVLISGSTCVVLLTSSSQRRVSLSFGLLLLFVMEKQMLMSAVLRYFRTLVLLLLVSCGCPLTRPSLAASNALHKLGDFTYPYGSIFSPLLKALSEHGGPRWNPGLERKIKPEHRYMKYLTEVYKKSSRVQRSLDGDQIYNTVRLIKPQDECLAPSKKGEELLDCHCWPL